AFARLQEDGSKLGALAPTFQAASEQLIAAKNVVLDDPAAMRERFVAAATQAGVVVHQVETPEAARETILGLLRERNVTLLAKGKSMVAEEIFLNHHLEDAGIRVVETDLGEWIIQLAHETPSHIVVPAIHKSKRQIAELFTKEVGIAPTDDVATLTGTARTFLRERFAAADVGISGVNFGVAETGTILILENE